MRAVPRQNSFFARTLSFSRVDSEAGRHYRAGIAPWNRRRPRPGLVCALVPALRPIALVILAAGTLLLSAGLIVHHRPHVRWS